MKTIRGIHKQPEGHWVGDGFPVHTAFHYQAHPELSPFLLLDHAGPVDFDPAPRQRGVGWHPHRGFETVTVVFAGEVEHEDTAGGGGAIGPGDVQWMTAGAGLLHKEMHGAAFARRGGRFEMLQLWVNLPAKSKLTAPRYQAITAAEIPTVPLPDDAGRVRVIAGTFGGTRGPAATFTPVTLLDVRLAAGKDALLPLTDGYTTALYILSGALRINDDAPATTGELVVLNRAGTDVGLHAEADTTLVVMHGEPIDEPVAGYGPFVMNTPAEIRQAITDFQAGRLGTAPATSDEA